MSIQAKVTSIEALELFRSNLILFLNKARRAVDDVGDEVRRTRSWLQTDRRMFWEHEIRRRIKMLDQAQQELMTVRMSGHQEAVLVRQAAVHKAERGLRDAEERLRRVKQWNRDYDSVADPAVKRLEGLRQHLDLDLPKAVAFLANAQKALEAYSEEMPTAAPSLVPSRPADESAEAATPETPSA